MSLIGLNLLFQMDGWQFEWFFNGNHKYILDDMRSLAFNALNQVPCLTGKQNELYFQFRFLRDASTSKKCTRSLGF